MSTEIFGEMHEVDVMPGMVIRPGDVLVVSCAYELNADVTARVREMVMTKMPGLADVVVLAHPLVVSAVYRPDIDEEIKHD